MSRQSLLSAVFGTLFLATAVLAQSSGKQASYSVPGHGKLQLVVPEGWTAEAQQPPGDLPPTIVFRSVPDQVELLVTVLWSAEGNPSFNSSESIKKQVAALGERLLPTAVEKEVTLHELKAPSGLGYWFSFTDRAPKPGEYKYMAQGAVPAGNLLLSFTALTHVAPPDGLGKALALLATAEQTPGAGQSSSGDTAGLSASAHEISLPGAGWGLVIDLPGYTVQAEQERPDGQGKMMQASNDRTKMIVSVFVDREPGLGSSTKCRDFYWTQDLQSPIPKSEVQLSEQGSMALVTWMVPKFQGVRVMQRNLKAFLGRGDICVDVHLSKAEYRPSDKELFDAVVRSIRIREH